MARRVADVRAAFRVLAGADPRDPFSISAPFEGEPVGAPIRVALVREPPGGSTAPAIAAAVRSAGDALADAGYDVVETEPPMIEAAIDTWARWLITEISLLKPILATIMSPAAVTFLQHAEDAIGTADVAGQMELLMQRHAIARAWSEFMVDHPLVVGPVWTQPPFVAGWDVESAQNAVATLELIRFVTPMNLLGLPSACVPTGLAGGLPTGVQVTGRRFREDLCLAGAEAIEDRIPSITPIDPR